MKFFSYTHTRALYSQRAFSYFKDTAPFLACFTPLPLYVHFPKSYNTLIYVGMSTQRKTENLPQEAEKPRNLEDGADDMKRECMYGQDEGTASLEGEEAVGKGCISEDSSEKWCEHVGILGWNWRMPKKEGKFITGLKVKNSMTGTVVEFVPQRGRKVKWYGCGPTVYDAAHLGHARTYVTFDILRRIMSDYFGYDVELVMNITDVDDKIIQRSFDKGISFTELARYWEEAFWNDMKLLNVKMPVVITRVSEYISEIISMISSVIENGYAYESEGSVYFNTDSFRANKAHFYGRMEPTAVNSLQRVLEGEGSLGVSSVTKRNPIDFALWKKAKANEPSWPSPWGPGRPGWHIECSAMACKILDFPLDIHSGGIDLRFPHHDNELAQSEAAYDKPQWVNYFLHSGHLHIHGSKMSKSLKNFITIEDFLKDYNFRHIRLLFLLNSWDCAMNFSTSGESLEEAIETDRSFGVLFSLFDCIKLQSNSAITSNLQNWNAKEFELNAKYQSLKEKADERLKDNFDTRGCVLALRSLASLLHVYMNGDEIGNLRIPLVEEAVAYLHRMLTIFGIISEGTSPYLYSEADSEISADALNPILACVGNFRRNVRSTLKQIILERCKNVKDANDENNTHTNASKDSILLDKLIHQLMTECDSLRDKHLPDANVLLEDRNDGSFVIKAAGRKEIEAEKQRKTAALEKKLLQKSKQDALMAKKAAEAAVSPSEFFITFHKGKYSEELDEAGIPLRLADGTEITKSARKSLMKMLEKHKKLHTEYLNKPMTNGGEHTPNKSGVHTPEESV